MQTDAYRFTSYLPAHSCAFCGISGILALCIHDQFFPTMSVLTPCINSTQHRALDPQRLRLGHVAGKQTPFCLHVRTAVPCKVARRCFTCRASAAGGDYSHPEQRKNSGPLQLTSAGSSGNGVFLLMLINVILFMADHLVHLPFIKTLYLNHAHPHWWQFVTHTFCHGSLQHLSSNLFHLCVFGKLVEETEGGFGVWFVYLVTGIGAALASFLTSPSMQNGHAVVSVGASGAVFGLFAVSVLMRLTSLGNIKRLLEAAVLGQFVVRQVLDEIKHQATGGLVLGGMQVSHVAHLGGALAGVLLVLLLHRLPVDSADRTPPAQFSG